MSHPYRHRLRTLLLLGCLHPCAFALAGEDGGSTAISETTSATSFTAEEETPISTETKKEAIDLKLVEKVVVSATVAKDRQDPATFTDLTREEIDSRNRGQDLGMLLGDSPNAYAYSDAGNGVGYSYLRLRGFDQARIAVNINGVPLNTPESHQVYYIDLADFAGSLDRIQIQRGTGTALYGSPAVGGVVNLETGSLEASPGGEVKFGVGSFGTYRASLRYGGSLAGGRWAWTARAAHVSSDGYRDPSWTRHTLAHFALQRSAENSIWRIHLFGGPERTQLAYFGLPIEYLRGMISGDPDRDRRVNFLKPGETDTFVQPHLQIINDRKIGEGLFLKNTWYAIVGRGYFRQFSDTLDYDPLGPASPSAQFPELTVENAWRRRWIGNRQLGWIPRVTWDHRRGTLAAGVELLFHEGRHRGTVQEGQICVDPDPGNPCSTTSPVGVPLVLYDFTNHKSTATAFVRETLRPVEHLAVNLELQRTHHRFAMRDDRVRGYSYNANYSFLTPRVGANWNVSSRWNVYGQVSTARSEPTFGNVWDPEDVFANPVSLFNRHDAVLQSYSDPKARPERLRNYEVGAGWSASAARFKANFYRLDFRDELVLAGGIDDDGLPITENAGRSVHEGIELEASGRLPGAVDLSGYAAFSRDVFDRYQILSPLASGGALFVDYSGNRVALFPDSMVRLRASRAFGPARIELGARRVGTIYLDNSENERKTPYVRSSAGYVDKKIDPFTLLDFQATLDLGRFLRGAGNSLSVDARVENLTDKRYAAIGYSYPVNAEYADFYTEFFPGATRNVFFGLTYGF